MKKQYVAPGLVRVGKATKLIRNYSIGAELEPANPTAFYARVRRGLATGVRGRALRSTGGRGAPPCSALDTRLHQTCEECCSYQVRALSGLRAFWWPIC